MDGSLVLYERRLVLRWLNVSGCLPANQAGTLSQRKAVWYVLSDFLLPESLALHDDPASLISDPEQSGSVLLPWSPRLKPEQPGIPHGDSCGLDCSRQQLWLHVGHPLVQ